jgi:hypothetical protein
MAIVLFGSVLSWYWKYYQDLGPYARVPGKIKFYAKKFPNFLPGTLVFYRIVNISNDQQMLLIITLP